MLLMVETTTTTATEEKTMSKTIETRNPLSFIPGPSRRRAMLVNASKFVRQAKAELGRSGSDELDAALRRVGELLFAESNAASREMNELPTHEHDMKLTKLYCQCADVTMVECINGADPVSGCGRLSRRGDSFTVRNRDGIVGTFRLDDVISVNGETITVEMNTPSRY
jgi:hypothetical protein